MPSTKEVEAGDPITQPEVTEVVSKLLAGRRG